MANVSYKTHIEAPVEAVFAFHERPDALTLLTPPSPRVTVVERTGGLEEGARVVLRLHAGPFGMNWVAVHTAYRKPHFFEDMQQSGPFRRWRHRHSFRSEAGGTLLLDEIEYELPGGWLVTALLQPIVERQLGAMFAYRHGVTKRYCEGG